MMAAPGKAGSSGETHFSVEVVSPKFEGLTLVKRQRMVYQVRDGARACSCVCCVCACCVRACSSGLTQASHVLPSHSMPSQLLGDEFNAGLHALTLNTKTPAEVEGP